MDLTSKAICYDYIDRIVKWCDKTGMIRCGLRGQYCVDDSKYESYYEGFDSLLMYIRDRHNNQFYEITIMITPELYIIVKNQESADTIMYLQQSKVNMSIRDMCSKFEEWALDNVKNHHTFPSFYLTQLQLFFKYLDYTIDFFKDFTKFVSVETITHNSIYEFFSDRTTKSFQNEDEIVCVKDGCVLLNFTKTTTGGFEYQFDYKGYTFSGIFNECSFVEFRTDFMNFVRNCQKDPWVKTINDANIPYLSSRRKIALRK